MSVQGVLKGHDVFRSLGVDEIASIGEFSSVKPFRIGEYVFRHRGAGSHVFVLLEGKVDLVLPSERQGLGIVVSELVKGEMFGLSQLLGIERHTTSATCRSDSDLLAIESAPLRELLRANHHAGHEVMNRVAQVCFARYMSVLHNLQDVVEQIPLAR